jgi:hypothetical protein
MAGFINDKDNFITELSPGPKYQNSISLYAVMNPLSGL